jgi:HD superfamily phosphohydrolase
MALIKELIAKAKSYLFARQQAYHQVFDKESRFAQTVLRDLAKFCRAHETTFHSNPRVQAALEGRREVWLRIEQHLKMTPDELWMITKRSDIND